jgi:hypothetical protein
MAPLTDGTTCSHLNPAPLIFSPHGIAGGGKNHFEMVAHGRVFFAHRDGRVDDHLGDIDKWSRHHHVDAEDTAGVFRVLVGLLKNLAEDDFRRVIGRSPAGFGKMAVNLRLILLGGDPARGQQPQNARIGRGDAQLVVAEGPHTGLNDGVLDAQQFTKRSIQHDGVSFGRA